MKCPSCTYDSKRSERTDSLCPKCSYRFVFDPPAPLSDAEMHKIISKVSSGGKLSYSLDQLACEVERSLTSRARKLATYGSLTLTREGLWVKIAFAVSILVGAWFSGMLESFYGMIATLVCWVIVLVLYVRAPTEKAAQRSLFVRLLGDLSNGRSIAERFIEAHPTAKLITGASRPALAEHPSIGLEFDLESYGFDRVVVLPSGTLVDVLVANQFHVQHNAAIVSFDGHPARVEAIVQRQLASASPPQVYVIEDFPPRSPDRVAAWASKMGITQDRIVRVGLSSSQVRRMWPKRRVINTGAMIEFSVPVDALRPEALANLLFNAFQGRIADDAMLVVLDDTVYDFG